MLKLKDEKGQALVEGALVVPIVLFFFLMIMQGAWLVYCSSCISSAVSHMQYTITPEEAQTCTDANALVKEKIEETSPIMRAGTLNVSGAVLETDTPEYSTVELADEDFEEYFFATKNAQTTRVNVSATVEYKPASLVPAVLDPTFTRVVESSRISEERFEIG